MRISIVVLFGAGILLSACSGEHEDGSDLGGGVDQDHSGHHMVEISEQEAADKKEAAALLVERFDADACGDADLLGALRRTNAEGAESILRSFETTAECGRETSEAMNRLGFEQDSDGIFNGTSDDGAIEKVKIKFADDAKAALVEWEVDRR